MVRFDKFLFYLMSCLMVVFGLLALVETVGLGHGDYKLYCKATSTYFEGKNPYNMVVVGIDFPHRYPPFTFYVFNVFCKFQPILVYSIINFLTVLILFFSDKNHKTRLKNTLFLFVPLLLMGFNATYYSLANGQMGTVDAFFMSLLFLLLVGKKYNWSAVVFGGMAILKTVPIAYTAVVVGLMIKKRKKVDMILISLCTFVGLHFFNALLFKKAYLQFVNFMLFSNYPLIDRADHINPSLFTVLGRNVWLCACFVLVIVHAYFLCLKLFKSSVHRFSFGVLAVMLVLPELKYYTFVIASVPIYFLVKDFGFAGKFWVLFVSCAFPVLAKLFIVSFGVPVGLARFFIYYQYFSLLFVVVIVVFAYGKKKWFRGVFRV